jgi:PBSX family phage terminase large subunit
MSDKFIKTDKQRQAIDILSGPAKHIALGGGSRSGKSFLLMYAMIVRACKVKSRHCVLRLNFNHIKRSIVLETMPKVMSICFPNLKYELNKTDYIVTLTNDSQIFFAGLDSGDRAEKILGQEFSGLWFNEISQIPYSSVQMALTRLAEKNDLKKKVYYDLNPSTKSSWAYSMFIKKLDPIDNVPLLNPDDYSYFQMNPADNLVNIDEEYLRLLSSMPEKERTRFLKGEFSDESDGQAYSAFRRDAHVKETVRTPGTIFANMDFNVSPMTCSLMQFVDNTFYIHDEIYLENSDTFKMADELIKRGYAGARVIPDSTGRNRKTSGQSDFEILKSKGFVIESTYNPFVTDRVNNTNRLLSSGRVVINPKCRKLINDLERVSWKSNKLDQSGEAKMLTHMSDNLGYGLWKLEPFTSKDALKVTQGER